MTSLARIVLLAAAAVLALTVWPPPDELDAFVQAQMAQRKIDGLSLAVIQDGRIDARAYGGSGRRARHDRHAVSGGIDQQTRGGHGRSEARRAGRVVAG